MYIIDILPDHIKNNINDSLLLVAKTDVDGEGVFTEQWLTLTDIEMSLFDQSGEIIQNFSIGDIDGARTVTSIGNGNLIIETESGPIQFLRFTSALSGKFSIVAKAIDKWSKGKEFPVISKRDLPRHCPTCSRRLQEGTNVCPLCLDKNKIISRLLEYAKPYRGQMILAAFLMVTVTVMGLAPPFITKIIIDDVLQQKDTGSILLILVLAIGATYFLSSLTTALRGYVGVRIGSHIMGDIRKVHMTHFLGFH